MRARTSLDYVVAGASQKSANDLFSSAWQFSASSSSSLSLSPAHKIPYFPNENRAILFHVRLHAQTNCMRGITATVMCGEKRIRQEYATSSSCVSKSR